MQQKHSLGSINGWSKNVLLFPGLWSSAANFIRCLYHWSAYEFTPKRSRDALRLRCMYPGRHDFQEGMSSFRETQPKRNGHALRFQRYRGCHHVHTTALKHVRLRTDACCWLPYTHQLLVRRAAAEHRKATFTPYPGLIMTTTTV